jgi:prophage antirepressor-like protein
MAEEQPMNEIKVFNIAYDTDHGLTKVIYRGREAAIAADLGRLLRYAKHGSKLVDRITDTWADRFHEGVDYEVLKGRDLQDFKAVSPPGVVNPSTPQLMILYASGVHLVLLNTDKPVGKSLHRWLVDEVFPSLTATGTYTLNPSDRKALPVPALFNEEIRRALSKVRNEYIAHQKARVTQLDFAIAWDETHMAHTASMFDGMGKTSKEIRAIARQQGVTKVDQKSARHLMYEMVNFRPSNISESAEIDLERIGLPREQARHIAITQGQPYFKALVDAGVDQGSLEQST